MAFSQLKADYECSKRDLVNSLQVKLREISVYSPIFENILSNIIKIQKECEINLEHRNLVSQLKKEIYDKRSQSSAKEENTNITLSMIERLDALYKDSDTPLSKSSSSNSNSNYDFELEAKEAKGK